MAADFPVEKKAHEQTACVRCHRDMTPQIVADWASSKHALPANDVSCSVCHGTAHSSPADVHKAEPASPRTCRTCHEDSWNEFRGGKHAMAWRTMEAFPGYHWAEHDADGGQEGCRECHRVGFKPGTALKELMQDPSLTGANACANCHAAHTFSRQEAAEPEACRSCHEGAQTPQWATYAASRHWEVVSASPDSKRLNAPTCQTCHLPQGEHGVGTAWGSLGVRLPWPEDRDWTLARKDVMTALRAYDPTSGPEGRLQTMYGHRMLRIENGPWEAERSRALEICGQCHEPGFARSRLEAGDAAIRESDLLLARAIQIVRDLRAEGLLPAASEESPFPDLTQPAPEGSEAMATLQAMFHVHRKTAFLGEVHASEEQITAEAMRRLEQHLEALQALERELKGGD